MQDLTAWLGAIGALFGGGAGIAVIAFWYSRGKEMGALQERLEARRADVDARIAAAVSSAATATAMAALCRDKLAETREEFARDYASHRDLSAAEARIANAVEGMRGEMRGLNDRLDRILEKHRD